MDNWSKSSEPENQIIYAPLRYKVRDAVCTDRMIVKESQPLCYWQMTNEPFLGQLVPHKPSKQQPAGSIVGPFLTGGHSKGTEKRVIIKNQTD